MSDLRLKNPGPGYTKVNVVGGRGGMLGNIDNPSAPHLSSGPPTIKGGKHRVTPSLSPLIGSSYFDESHRMKMAAPIKSKPKKLQPWEIEAALIKLKTTDPQRYEELQEESMKRNIARHATERVGSRTHAGFGARPNQLPLKPQIKPKPQPRGSFHREPLVRSSNTVTPSAVSFESNT